MSANANAPVIIKRKKVVAGGGHHGGAWKVAYADFVTAMMAFFMLMWLLNATTEKQRKGIADYFSPTIPVMRISGGGDGSFGGDSVFTQDSLAQNGTGGAANMSASDTAATTSEGSGTQDAEKKLFSEISNTLTGNSGESMVSPKKLRHIVTRVTDEGLIIDLFDIGEDSLFVGETDEPTDLLIELTAMITRVFGMVDNQIAIGGFTRSRPIIVTDNPVWNLSSSRADAARVLMEKQGMVETRIQRVSGYADRKPVVSNPMSPRNNRLELILLRTGR